MHNYVCKIFVTQNLKGKDIITNIKAFKFGLNTPQLFLKGALNISEEAKLFYKWSFCLYFSLSACLSVTQYLRRFSSNYKCTLLTKYLWIVLSTPSPLLNWNFIPLTVYTPRHEWGQLTLNFTGTQSFRIMLLNLLTSKFNL